MPEAASRALRFPDPGLRPLDDRSLSGITGCHASQSRNPPLDLTIDLCPGNTHRIESRLPRPVATRIDSPGWDFILLSCSHVVDFGALTDLLLEGRFSAAIDVFPKEPLPMDHPILQAPNVILSSHRAGPTDQAFKSIGHMITNALEAILHGLPPREMQAADPAYIGLRAEKRSG